MMKNKTHFMNIKVLALFALIGQLLVVEAYAQQVQTINDRHTQIDLGSIHVKDSLGKSTGIGKSLNKIRKVGDHLYYVNAVITPGQPEWINEIDIPVVLPLGGEKAIAQARNAFHWMPNLKSAPCQIVSEHVFRAPCFLQCLNASSVAVFPDLTLLRDNHIAPYYMDLEYQHSKIVLHYGLANYKTQGHVYYAKASKPFKIDRPLTIGMYILLVDGNRADQLLARADQFLWKTWASGLVRSVLPQTMPYQQYADTGYAEAIRDYWVDAGKDKGGITLSTFFDDTVKKVQLGRSFKNDLWFHSWFDGLRTAYGMYAWGRQTGNQDWCNRALRTVNLWMSAPRANGWVPSIYNSVDSQWVAAGAGGSDQLYHVPDLAWTAYWLMRFSNEQQEVSGADGLLDTIGQSMLRIQQPNGNFPTRIDIQTLAPDSILLSSASSGICTWLLEEMLLQHRVRAGDIAKYQRAIKRSLAFLSRDILPVAKFEDFEVYFSCSPKPNHHWYDSATAAYPQNTLSIQWCAEAYLDAYKLFNDQSYLAQGEYCLNLLSLYQQVWNPPFIGYYTFGGFGAQNSDAEWSDARQAQFAETYLNFYEATHRQEYLERAVAACRASFTLMTLPQNKKVAPLTYRASGPIFLNAGNMPENYGHSGDDTPAGQSGFHWGTGSALTTAIIFKHKLGDLYIDPARKTAVGIDGVAVKTVDWGEVIDIKTGRLDAHQPLDVRTPRFKTARLTIDGKRFDN